PARSRSPTWSSTATIASCAWKPRPAPSVEVKRFRPADRSMFSKTVCPGKTDGVWNFRMTPALAIACGLIPSTLTGSLNRARPAATRRGYRRGGDGTAPPRQERLGPGGERDQPLRKEHDDGHEEAAEDDRPERRVGRGQHAPEPVDGDGPDQGTPERAAAAECD